MHNCLIVYADTFCWGVSALDVDLSLDEADCLQEINATPGLVYIWLVGFRLVWILY